MKRLIVVFFLLISVFSCFGRNDSVSRKEYKEYKSKILPKLKKDESLTEKQRDEILKLFTIDYKGQRIDKFILNEKVKTEDIKAIIFIKLLANYKTDLTELKRGFKDKKFDEKEYKEILNKLDNSVTLYLNFYGLDSVPKNTLYNPKNEEISIQKLLDSIKVDFDIK